MSQVIWWKWNCPRSAIPLSPDSLSCLHDDVGLPSKKEEKSNLPECPRNFSHTSVFILYSPSSFHLTQKICRASVSLYHIALLILVMGLPRQFVTKQLYSVGEISFWLTELLTDLCSDSKSDIPLSQRGQQPEETEINGKSLITAAAWEVGEGQLQGALFPSCISAPTARDNSILFSFHPQAEHRKANLKDSRATPLTHSFPLHQSCTEDTFLSQSKSSGHGPRGK